MDVYDVSFRWKTEGQESAELIFHWEAYTLVVIALTEQPVFRRPRKTRVAGAQILVKQGMSIRIPCSIANFSLTSLMRWNGKLRKYTHEIGTPDLTDVAISSPFREID